MVDRSLVEQYMERPYTIAIRKIVDESGKYYAAEVLELDGCFSVGDTPEEVYKNVREAMEGWLETKLEHGLEIPEPANDDHYSGRFVVRVPKSLHRKLAQQAKLEGVSLNQLVLYKLSR